MTIPDPTYVTAEEVKENTRIAGLSALADDDVGFLIQHAEDQIDARCGPQMHHPYDDNVERVFPRDCDYRRTSTAEYPLEPEIPYLISRACLLQVEYLYLNWWPDVETRQATLSSPVQSESIGGDGTYSATYARGGLDLSAATLAPPVLAILDRQFTSRVAEIGLPDPRGSARLLRSETGYLSSRE